MGSSSGGGDAASTCAPRGGGLDVREEGKDAGRELVGALDLRHVADAGEQFGRGMREEAASGVEMLRGQDAVLVSPDHERGTGVFRGCCDQ